jgi:hypothetical protein
VAMRARNPCLLIRRLLRGRYDGFMRAFLQSEPGKLVRKWGVVKTDGQAVGRSTDRVPSLLSKRRQRGSAPPTPRVSRREVGIATLPPPPLGVPQEPKVFPISCGPISFCQERVRANLRMVDFSTPVP